MTEALVGSVEDTFINALLKPLTVLLAAYVVSLTLGLVAEALQKSKTAL